MQIEINFSVFWAKPKGQELHIDKQVTGTTPLKKCIFVHLIQFVVHTFANLVRQVSALTVLELIDYGIQLKFKTNTIGGWPDGWVRFHGWILSDPAVVLGYTFK